MGQSRKQKHDFVFPPVYSVRQRGNFAYTSVETSFPLENVYCCISSEDKGECCWLRKPSAMKHNPFLTPNQCVRPFAVFTRYTVEDIWGLIAWFSLRSVSLSRMRIVFPFIGCRAPHGALPSKHLTHWSLHQCWLSIGPRDQLRWNFHKYIHFFFKGMHWNFVCKMESIRCLDVLWFHSGNFNTECSLWWKQKTHLSIIILGVSQSGLTLIPAWISNHISRKIWNEI